MLFMVNWQRIAGIVAILAGLGLQYAHNQLNVRKGDFLIASNAQIRLAEASKPQPGEGTKEQYLVVSLEAERECKRLYADRFFALNRYCIEQSYISLWYWLCLHAAGLCLIVTSRRQSAMPQPPNNAIQQTPAVSSIL